MKTMVENAENAPSSHLSSSQALGKILIPAGALLSLWPMVSSGVALLMGIAVALSVGNPYFVRTKKLTHILLAWSVMGLGAGMNLKVVGRVGFEGLGYTVVGIATTLLVGTLIGKWMRTERDVSLLISAGTAICGGSAIAALAPTMKAKHHDVSVALGTVFMLNALALFLFPWVGHTLHLSEGQFGLWSALAIHDTSSVVGATLQYGAQAVQIGTTVKLARALWIVPVTFAVGMIYARDRSTPSNEKPKRPWFILGFIAVAALVTWIPGIQDAGHSVATVAQRSLVLTLFLIGSNLSRATLKAVGIRPFVQGVALWIFVGSATLGAILAGWIHT